MEQHANPEFIELRSASGAVVPVKIAGVGARSYAFLIDWHIRILLSLAWLLGVAVVLTGSLSLSGMSSLFTGTFLYLGVIPSAILYLFYHPVLELAMQGRTPGKRMTGIRILAKSGEKASAGAILIRNIFRLVDSLPGTYGVGLVAALFDRQSARIGDMAAGTLLVYENRARATDLQAVVGHSGTLSPQARELILELAERWHQLDKEQRRTLADSLFRMAGKEPPQLREFEDDARYPVELKALLDA